MKGNTFPDAPGDVSAEMQGTELVIRWEDGSDNESPTSALRYNLFVRNETTEETYCLIPANRKTGKLKVGTDLQTSLSSWGKTYRIKPFGDGKYTVGVQTLDQSYAGSTFRTCTLEVNTRVASASLSGQFKIIKNGHNIEVKSPLHEQVKVYGTDGCLVAHGTTNETIVLPAHGTFLVSAGTYKEKVLF